MKASVSVGLAVIAISASAAAQQNPDLSAGGLAPPEAIEGEADQAQKRQQTEADLEKAEQEDAGRGLEFFWVNGDVGIQHMGLGSFDSSNLVDGTQVDTTQTGLVYGGGLGFRLVFLTFGARFRMMTLTDYSAWTVNGEMGWRIPLGALEPYFTFGGGYVKVGSFDSEAVGADLNEAGVDIDGFDLRASVGLDYYLSETFSIGGNVSGDALFLWRAPLDASEIAAQSLDADVYGGGGSSVGAAGALTLVLGLHF